MVLGMQSLRALGLRLEKRWIDRLQRGTLTGLAPHLGTGIRGEQEALYYLRSKGYEVVSQRWSSAKVRGDLDLVAWLSEADLLLLVVVEVKTRTRRDFAPPDSAVDAPKRKQLRRVTDAYLRQFPREVRDKIAVRFDVLSVYLLPTGTEIEHFPGAFGTQEHVASDFRSSGV